MNQGSHFDQAILAHTNWLDRFQNILEGKDEVPSNPDQIGNDTKCEFGKWLFSNPELFRDHELYNRIIELHRSFHHHAAEIASLLNQHRHRIDVEASLFHLRASSGQLISAMRQAEESIRN